jgi:alanine racemase
MIQFSQLKEIIRGSVLTLSTDRPVTQLITDSRKAIIQNGSVFFAIGGEHHDGHQYIQSLYDAGVKQFIIEKGFPTEKYPEANFLKVESVVQALQKIAAYHREKFSIPIIGITGSNGKTIIKEWLYQLLSKEYTIVKNPGSYVANAIASHARNIRGGYFEAR